MAWPQQLERGCWLGEWPFDEGCADVPAPGDRSSDPSFYQRHVMRNVGDANAYVRMMYALWTAGDTRAQGMLHHAQVLAPHDPRVLAVQASEGIAKQDWNSAASALVTLVEAGHVGARKPLLAMMQDSAVRDTVLELLVADSRWLDVMLSNLPRDTPPAPLQPFISKGYALGVVRPAIALNMVDRLKASGDWLDAYTLWVSLRSNVNSDLYNPGFEQKSLRKGFDWEWPQPAAKAPGFRVTQVPATPRAGLMMELELTSRGALPAYLIGQSLILLGDEYQLEGQFMSDRMRTKEGLVWGLRCAGMKSERWAQSAPLMDTKRQWQKFEIRFKVPAECSGVVRLQLETTASWEARAGMAGIMYFDDFSLTPLGKRTE